MKTPTLLTLLKQGCTITFPSGYSLTGSPKKCYIEERIPIETYSLEGLKNLSKEGLQDAIQNEKAYREQQEMGED